MRNEPETWHYGLVARWWAEFNTADPEELAFYQGFVARDGQPALDLACGTGRLLLPLLRAGLDVDGCDLSPDMLAQCREQAAREGVAPQLSAQAMHALALPRTYRTIFICDSFGLGGRRDHDAETLRRCYRHLAPGGALVFSQYLPYANTAEWASWPPAQRQPLPQPWPERGDRRRAANGDELETRVRLVALDPLAQRRTLQIRASLWRDGRMVAEEESTLQESLYFRNELQLMLAQAGWTDITIYRGYSGEVATADDTMLAFVARKDA
jgi:SAM-dependent methyltransferase